jgi:acetoin:2,6-dichlorophenolindophenol oxidoreductase subunit alpha
VHAPQDAGSSTIDTKVGLELLGQMWAIRAFEDEVQRLFTQGVVRGTTHLCQGQEAVPVGVCSLLRENDSMTCTYRGHGAVLSMGAPLDESFGEIMGKERGLCGGKGGSMHLTDVRVGAYGSYAIVGAHLPVAVGLAFASRYRDASDVSVCFFGDGSTNIGAFHESLNLAAVWKLPVVFVCENNGFGEFTPMATVTSVKDIAVRAKAYDIPGQIVDGNDVLEVFRYTSEAVARARAGEGPTLLECKTYRWEGHFVGEQAILGDGAYREQSEVEQWRRKCPLIRFEKWCAKSGKISSAELTKIVAETEKELADAVEFARSSELPAPSEVTDDVYN